MYMYRDIAEILQSVTACPSPGSANVNTFHDHNIFVATKTPASMFLFT